MQFGRGEHLFWVADAAKSIAKGLSVQPLDAIQTVDNGHGCEHVDGPA